MSSSADSSAARNAPCPCGSGRKFKHCCGVARGPASATASPCAAPAARSVSASTKAVLIGTGAAVVGAIALMVFVTDRRPEAPAATPAPVAGTESAAVPGAPGGPTPEPWFYDATLNRHWDPTPGHNHWHNGPPPIVAGLPVNPAAAGATPAPWFHDVVNNRHWDPTPGHNHWHDGPPPPAEQRK